MLRQLEGLDVSHLSRLLAGGLQDVSPAGGGPAKTVGSEAELKERAFPTSPRRLARLRIAFFGTPAFAVPTLTALLATQDEVVAVVSQPDRPSGRGHRVTAGPVKTLGVRRGLRILQPEKIKRDELEPVVRALDLDLGVVAAYGKILPQWLLELPRLGMVNVHASLLPRYRGAAPVHRAIMAGERETGVTIMRVVQALDAGPMMARVVRPIDPDETSDIVERDLAALGADLLVQTVAAMKEGRAIETPQDDAQATYAARLTREDGRIDWSGPARAVHNRIRGLHPWPHAYTYLNGMRYIIHRSRLPQAELARLATSGALNAESKGTIVEASPGRLAVACGDGAELELLEIQPGGRRPMTAREFLAGHALKVGERFD